MGRVMGMVWGVDNFTGLLYSRGGNPANLAEEASHNMLSEHTCLLPTLVLSSLYHCYYISMFTDL
jgi:hypothetical protein